MRLRGELALGGESAQPAKFCPIALASELTSQSDWVRTWPQMTVREKDGPNAGSCRKTFGFVTISCFVSLFVYRGKLYQLNRVPGE